MLAPPMRLSYRLAAVALVLFSVLFLYNLSRTTESWVSWSLGDSLPGVGMRPEVPEIPDAPSATPVPPSHGGVPSTSPTVVVAAPDDTPTSEESLDQTAAAAPSEPAEGSVDGIVVIGKLQSENTDWVSEKLPDWQNAIYIVDNQSAPLHTPMNKGREANPYLTYIIENYHNLPKTIVFLHPHQDGYPGGWHTDAPNHSNVWSVENLNLDFVQETGYANLRCTHIPGCPDEIQPFRDPFDPSRTSENHMLEAWQDLFGNSDVPDVIGAACCAQFAVSRDQVLKRPLDDYVRYRKWIIDTPLEDDLSGRIIEYLWHIIFGKPAVDCPAQDQCFRDVYRVDTQFNIF
ncbi:uncharacterized protein BKCO1_35000126 [Diplodia corticola]|uniref:Uncharacterized protein n=1 Tax=Diplodia corticola TaxID=236234 RepID=A0A1J9RZF2_9PEZI|nr:uncharacterized protein BKCO1_35000126 [Diplodia corticola]OJD32829.1 hypothetical protein BKCO1_35000126 [Diplodia corticola]